MSFPLKVGIREFRAQLPHYLLEVGLPIAITRHGETIGYYIPSKETASQNDLTALKAAAARLDALLADAGVDEELLLQDFREARGRNPA